MYVKDYLKEQWDNTREGLKIIAEQKYYADPVLQKEKSVKWLQNLTIFNHFYFTSDPLKIAMYYYLEPFPEWFEVEPTTYCNLKCKMCEHTYWKEPNKHMSLEQFKGIVDQFPELKWIGATGIGEGLMNPDYGEMIHYVKEKDPAIYIELFDPFILTTEKTFNEWVDYGLDKVYVSLDAAHLGTYAIQRPRVDFNKVLKNIQLLDRIKKEKGKHFPQICFHFIINKYNICDVIDYISLIKNLNIDVWFIQYTRMLHSFPEVEDMFVDIPPELGIKVREEGQRLGMQTTFNANTAIQKPPINHCTAYTQPFIFVTGHVIPCCSCNEGNEREYQKATALGNVFEQSMKEVWYGNKFRELRRMVYYNETHPICKRCPLFVGEGVSG
jgi:MoaA/NifB/PqqE/SkfB family radical SAM enzyme